MIRNQIERRNSAKKLSDLRAELEKRSRSDAPDAQQGIAEALKLQVSDIETEIAEYDDLKTRRASTIAAETIDDFGKLLIQARIAKGWSQGKLAEALDMEPQQVQRYERNDWQTASLWRLQEVVEALGLDVSIRARVRGHDGKVTGSSLKVDSFWDTFHGTASSLGWDPAAAPTVMLDSSWAPVAQLMEISDTWHVSWHVSPEKMLRVPYKKPRPGSNAQQMTLEGTNLREKVASG